jgi:transcription antitermination factor NusG
VLKLDENPPMVLPGGKALSELAGQWWVAHTKSRFEKAFAWDLLHRGIAYFLPMIERVRLARVRRYRVMEPLFPSYVFFCGTADDRYVAMTTNRLCQTLDVPDHQTLVRELGTIETALVGKAPLDPYPFAAVGRRCRVIAGPFLGLEGTVIQRNGVTRLVLQVSMLGQGAALDVDASMLEAV